MKNLTSKNPETTRSTTEIKNSGSLCGSLCRTLRFSAVKIILLLLMGNMAHAMENTRAEKKPADYVNPFIGASTQCKAPFDWGKTFPGAATPFGIVQVSPGETRFEITSPSFDRSDIRVGEGKTFSIVADDNNQENTYIQSARLNGKPYSKCWLDLHDIMKGGVLELSMGKQPNKEWGL